MTKHLIVFTILLTALFFIIGCPQVTPEPIETPKAEPPKVETPKVEPAKVEPPQPEPSKPEPLKVEMPKPEPPKAEIPKPKPRPAVSFHDKCADILTNFVDDKAMVNYRALKRKRLQLKQLLDEFDNLDPNEYNSWPREDKIAFWINAYNIQMLKVIVDNYPIKSSRILRVVWGPDSIRHIPPRSTIGVSKWDEYKFLVMDEEFTLSEIERRFFHKEFKEPRAFLALSGASLSSPLLRNEPYYGNKLYKQLDDQTKKFLSSHLAFKIDRAKQIVYLSTILQPNWYGKAFVSKYRTDKKFKDQQPAVRAVLNFLTNYISEQDVSFLETGNYSVKYINYDWTLNDGS